MSHGVFCHYMVWGVNATEAAIDVAAAKAMGFDAFALDVLNFETSSTFWSNEAIANLFAAALAIGFHLFFSFDTLHFTDPSQFFYLLNNYTSHGAYYQYNNKPFVSTFYGGKMTFGDSTPNAGWQNKFIDAYGKPVYFAPAFSDATRIPALSSPSKMYTDYPVADALMSWDSAWPEIADGKKNVSSTIDQEYQTAAVAAGKDFIMPMSTLQSKHLDSSDNWYRRGELNLALRMPQVLSVNPTFVEYLTWNDGSESTYIGTVWHDGASGAPSASNGYGFDHSGWQNIIAPFISTFKNSTGKSTASDIVPLNGATAVGTFWYRTILTTATCASDSLGKPNGWSNAEDVINVAVILSSAATVNAYSGGVKIGSQSGVKGLNAFSFSGLKTGAVKVEVVNSAGTTILTATGGTHVAADAAICNYNYFVVPLSKA